MRELVHRSGGLHNAQALYSNRTARTLQQNLRRQSLPQNYLKSLFLLGAVLIFCSTAYLSWSLLSFNKESVKRPGKLVSRIAFGSSSAHEYGSQPVWVDGVIPSDPHVWIWAGDMAYLDEARVNCDAWPSHVQCNCSASWLNHPPYACMAGDLQHATSRMQAQLANPDYAKFLAFMCPGHRERGLFPPPGFDPSICPRSIFGTYDDHDYSWEHGNGRLPNKDALKQVFLDAIGEPPNSSRRSHGRGIEFKYTLNQGIKGQEIDIILLDTRYYRDPLPCYTRRSFCEEVLRSNTSHEQYQWCLDFLKGGETATGSCCPKDEMLLHEWCSHKDACDPSSPGYAENIWEALHLGRESPEASFCEVLGNDQRKWLEDILLHSEAPLKLLVSSSVVLSTKLKDERGVCSGDDWECYKPAQKNLLNLISKARGCVVILTGDSEYSDIRVVRPEERRYSHSKISYPLYQVMSSGLTVSKDRDFPCDEARSDPLKLRDHEECDFARAPSFGMIEMEDSVVKLQIRDGMTGQVKLESRFTIGSCS